MTVKLLAVVGTRPEIIKAHSVLKEAARRGHDAAVVHTGQHYDFQLSGVFFSELEIEAPRRFLAIGSGSHGEQISEGARKMEAAAREEAPEGILVVGDTNSTLLGALVGAKLGIPVLHVEAGVRSFDWTMPEEINRRLVDSVSARCFAPTPRAFRQLQREGRGDAAVLVGDTLVEVALPLAARARNASTVLARLGLVPGGYALATVHRSENTDQPERLASIFRGLAGLGFPVVVPLHPRTLARLRGFGMVPPPDGPVRVVEPLGYLDFLRLLSEARFALTDSGGVQQEAAILNVPLLTLRRNTEWVETIEAGKNLLVGTEASVIVAAGRRLLDDPSVHKAMVNGPCPFVPGAAARILDAIEAASSDGSLIYPSSNFLDGGLPG